MSNSRPSGGACVDGAPPDAPPIQARDRQPPSRPMKFRIRWQQVLRIILAVAAIVFAAAVWLAIRERRPPSASDARTLRTDPKAVAESRRGESMMARGTQQDFRVQYERMFT